jgi:hypothetical protein
VGSNPTRPTADQHERPLKTDNPAGEDSERRRRGRIERRGDTLRVRVYAGDDPVTGKRVYRSETVQVTDCAAEKTPVARFTTMSSDA